MRDETITLLGVHQIGDGLTYGPGEVTVPAHVAEVLRRMDTPLQEQAAALTEAAKAERAAKKAEA